MRKRLLVFLLVFAVFGYMGWRLVQDWPRVAVLFDTFHPAFFGLHLLLLALMSFLLVLGWHVIMREFVPHLTLRESASIWLIPNIGKYAPGKVVMVAGRVGLCMRNGIKEGDCFCGLLLEHALVILATLPFMPLVISKMANVHAQSLQIMAIVGFVLCAAVVLSINRIQKWLNHLLKIMKRQPVSFHFPLRLTVKAFLIYLLTFGVYGFSGWVLYRTFNLGTAISPVYMTCAFVTAWLIGLLSFLAPGGLGVREGVLVLLLAAPGSTPQFMAFAILSRLTWVVVELLGALLGLSWRKDLQRQR